jgi:hypothetical protein
MENFAYLEVYFAFPSPVGFCGFHNLSDHFKMCLPQ